ncbi:hypothetical protein CEXT_810091 [Caerostris extrusa]|uniref:Uncharacterized protein n=1 Tax=Caerostris extrusa TaxID=172846 RepID=A0AAV4U1K9_CAEEX|nr:hypothetical protein CEXT_810091 [Caerostris extrusa]
MFYKKPFFDQPDQTEKKHGYGCSASLAIFHNFRFHLACKEICFHFILFGVTYLFFLQGWGQRIPFPIRTLKRPICILRLLDKLPKRPLSPHKGIELYCVDLECLSSAIRTSSFIQKKEVLERVTSSASFFSFYDL